MRLNLVPETGTSWGFAGGQTVVPLRGALAGASPDIRIVESPSWLAWARPEGAEIIAVAPLGNAAIFGFEGRETVETVLRFRGAAFLGLGAATPSPAAWSFFDELVNRSVGVPLQRKRLGGDGRVGSGPASLLTGASGTVLLVVGNLTLSTEDAGFKTRLEAMGFTVQTILATAATATDAGGKALVFISGSSASGAAAKFLNRTEPVLVNSTGVLDDMSMTSNANRFNDASATLASVVSPAHGIALPLSGSVTVGLTSVLQAAGVGGTGAQNVMSTNANAAHYAIFVYPTGASMYDDVAPYGDVTAQGPRAFYGLNAPGDLTNEGLDLFDRTIFWTVGINRPPQVNAGPDQSAYDNLPITLSGSVIDDGLPISPGSTTKTWTMVSGPPGGSISFGSEHSAVTTATFDKGGVYVAQLAASDGSLAADDTVTVNVFDANANEPPIVSAGADKAAVVSTAVTLTGSASDDGLPLGSSLALSWTKVSGPGTVAFGTSTAASTTATFSLPGQYVVRLTATEKIGTTPHLSTFDEAVVNVAPSVLLVVGSLSLNPEDALINARLESLGFQVTVQLAASTVANDANGKTFVWVSHSPSNGDLLDGLGNAKFLNKGVPVVYQPLGTVDDMGMTVSRDFAPSQTHVTMTTTGWLGAGIVGTVATSSPSTYDWCIPAATALKIAGIASAPTESVLFAYEAGAIMSSGLQAPARRFFVGLDIATATPTMLRLFDQAVYWMAYRDGPPVAYAGPDQAIAWSAPSVVANLAGAASDDGLPGGFVLRTLWSAVNPPAAVTFGNPKALSTTVAFGAPGDYLLRLNASETKTAPLPVSWTSVVGASAAGGGTLTKNVASAAFDAGAVSSQSLTGGDGYVEASVTPTGGSAAFGLGNGNTNSSHTDIEFAIMVLLDNSVKVWESGIDRGTFTTASSTDVFRVAVVGNQVKYSKNGSVFYTSGVAPMYPLVADASIYSNSASVANASFFATGEPIAWTSEVGATATGNSLTKNAGTSLFDSGALSVQSIASGDGFMEASVTPSGGAAAFGLGNGNSNNSYTDIEFGIMVLLDGSVKVWESGTDRGAFTTAAPSDVFRVAVVGGQVKYSKNGSVFYTSGVTPSYPLTADVSIYSNAASIANAQFSTSSYDQALKSASDYMIVSVVDGSLNDLPAVNAGPDRTVRLPAGLTISGIVVDDGMPASPGVTTVSWSKVVGPGTATFTPSNASTTSVTFSVAGTYVLRLTANDGSTPSRPVSDEVIVVVQEAKEALLCVGNLSLDPADTVAKSVLEGMGFAVTVTANSNAAEANGKQLVVISASVNSVGMASTYTSKAVPVVAWEQFVFDDMGMAFPPEGTNIGTITGTTISVVAPAHPLSANLSDQQTVNAVSGEIGWGVVGVNAIKVATLAGDANKATIFGYEAGAPMASGTAPARRVGLFVRPDILNTTGLDLFRAAIRWATERPVPALLVTAGASPSAGEEAIRDRMTGLGLSVATIEDSAATTASANGKAIVVLAPGAVTSACKTVGNPGYSTFSTVYVPAVAMDPGCALYGIKGRLAPSGTQVSMLDSEHPLGAHLSGTVAIAATGVSLGYVGSSDFLGEIPIAALPSSPTDLSVLGYEAGAYIGSFNLGGFLPTALYQNDRRVGLFLGADAGTNLTASGWALFDAAIRWAIASDADHDGLTTADEYRNGTSPTDADSNDNGIPDGAEVKSGKDPLTTDSDGDGIANGTEMTNGTDPLNWDTDGDGFADTECFPKDPARAGACPTATPGDTSPPSITLVKPSGATVVSIVPPI